MTVKTRFAPSPTGFLHVGGARTALYSWLHARHQQGEFVLRIEDTDVERSTQEAIDAILEGMNWLGLTWDEGPYYQTQRFDRYNTLIDQLVAEDKAYPCYCSRERLDKLREQQMAAGEKPRYDGHCRDSNEAHDANEPCVIRFKNPLAGAVVFDDRVRGRIDIANSQLDDLIIRRTDGTPTYNFCVVVDDWDMGITHVVRGEDHINNTPRQINIYHALNAPVPEFSHVSMILGDDGAKLSKRHGAISVMQYRDDGYLPQALLNYLVRLGWSHGDQEIFTLDEMINLFSLDGISKSASAFNTEKLLWLNQHYLKTLPGEEVASHLQWHMTNQGIDSSQGPALASIVALYADRCHTLKEMAEQSRYLFTDITGFDEAAAKKHLRPVAAAPLELVRTKLAALTDWDEARIQEQINAVAAELELGMGKVGMPLRVAVTGAGQSPAINGVIALLSQEQTLARIDMALAFIAERAKG